MKRESTHRRQHREACYVRDAWRQANPYCQAPRCKSVATDPHEITRGTDRGVSLDHPALLLHLCRRCHERIQGMTLAQQLAIKRATNDGTFCLEIVRLVKRGPHGRVSARVIEEAEVEEAARELGLI